MPQGRHVDHRPLVSLGRFHRGLPHQVGVASHQLIGGIVDGIGQLHRVLLLTQRQLDGELALPRRNGDVAHRVEFFDQLDGIGLDQPDHRQRLIGSVLHHRQVAYPLVEQADGIVDLAAANARLWVFLPNQPLQLVVELSQPLLAGGNMQSQALSLVAHDDVHAVELADPLAHQCLLRAHVTHQLLDLLVGIAEFLHQLALGGAHAVDQATDHWHLGALVQTLQLQRTGNAHHLAQLVAGRVQVAVAHMIEQLTRKRRALARRLAAEHVQVARGDVVQRTYDLRDLRAIGLGQPQCHQGGGIHVRGRAGRQWQGVLGHQLFSLSKKRDAAREQSVAGRLLTAV